MLSSIIIRGVAGGTVIAGGVLYAMQVGWIPGANAAEPIGDLAEEVTLTSSSQPRNSYTPIQPTIEGNDIIIPSAEQALAPQISSAPPTLRGPVTETSAFGLPCDVSVTATAMPAAMVALDIMTPCRLGAPVVVNHSGLQIMATTDAVGLLALDIPAFQSPAFFLVTFDDGLEESALVTLPDLQNFDRIGLGWQGDMGLELHAMESGAAFGDPGHIWHEAPATPDVALAGEGGFLTALDTGSSFVQIYTLPRVSLRENEPVALSIDAPITAENCGHDVVARTLRTEGGGPVDVIELAFTVPGCDAVGDILVLQNMLDDLRLASN